ncbi:methyltransferase domain-containing protein [Limibacillus sp. MBR-115]|jgi:phosphoethanolamine N-methyltransferase|uniref:methyltransferase domain-containing protein n=1 Tax=Limibacillus sp. MBR-115 TaxID=3156465 RepID=UPI0033992C31
MSGQHEEEYSDSLIDFLEVVWGEGYLSPGGGEEVSRILEGLSLAGRRVLDIGCGSGGIAMELVTRYAAGAVVGIDVEAGVLKRAETRIAAAGLADRITLRKVAPGPLPFKETAFDIVFSKDSMIHIPDKEALFADVFRVLKPGGWFVASDWLISHDGEPSDDMKAYVALEGLSFGMASPQRYAKALESAGFVEVALSNRNAWYRSVAERELSAIAGELYGPACEAAGRETVDHNIRTWEAMLKVLRSGEHCPHHLRARKPA